MTLYMLVNTGIKQSIVHSVHKTEAEAEAWRRCKRYEGEDMIVVIIDDDEVDTIVRATEGD